MKKKLNIIAVIMLAAFSGALLRAESPDLAAQFPDADSVTVEEVERVAYNPDGTSESRSEAWVKILTEKGRREESRLELSYSRRYGSAAIEYVGAIGDDGVERRIDVEATTKESTDNSSMSANIYDPLDRKIVCTIPGLKVGDTLHIKILRKTDKSRIKNHWADIAVMEWNAPILKSVYEVKAPSSRPIRAKAVRNALGNIVYGEKVLDDGSVLHSFTATNSPQMFPEPDMPPAYTEVQNIRLSTAASWQEISKWYWDLCLPHLEKTNAAISNKVTELKGDLKGEALVRSVFKFVSQEIRYMGLTMEDVSPGYAPHDVDITFNNRYGVCRDKAGLLTAMLRIAGLKAYPVLINVGARMDDDVPQPYFNHAIVAVERDWEGGRGYMLMDPTNENTKDIFPAYLSDKSYLVCRPEGERLMTSPVPKSSDNAVDVVTSGSLSRDGTLVMESSISFLGVNDTVYRGALSRRTREERVKLFERIIGGLQSGAELMGCEITPHDMSDTESPVTAKLVWRITEAAIEGRIRTELPVPFVSKVLGYANWLLGGSTSLSRRKYPLVLDTTAEVRESVTLDLGGNALAVESLPEALEIEGGYSYSRKFEFHSGVLSAVRRMAVGAMEFSPSEYMNLRENIKRVEAAERRRAIFSRDKTADADVELLLKSSESTILDKETSTSWVTTNEVVKRVLNYAGKKSAAELKFSYNPSWQKFTLLSAAVSNANGKVYSVSPGEINEMDAGWVAAAPRYAAEKLVVVNLPSVEIGSVISYKTVVEAKGSGAPFYACYLFDSANPAKRIAVRVDDWRREVVQPERIPNEPAQPAARLWRDVVCVSRGDWQSFRKYLLPAAEVPECELPAELKDAGLKEIRDWMAKYVKIAGPSLYDLPVSSQLTDPAVVLKERYATALDYVRTMAGLLKSAGFEVAIVFASPSSQSQPEVLRLDRETYPNMRAYSRPLCRVRVKEGGLWGFGGDEKTYYLGTESEYALLGATVNDGCDAFDPVEGGFVTIEAQTDFKAFKRERSVYFVRENGAVDIEYELERYGDVGSFRKRFSEILPEERSRYYQTLLGGIAQAASATGELVTDTEGYPAKMSFKCFVPDFATEEKGVITLELPQFDCPLPAFSAAVRKTPFVIASGSDSEEIVEVRFPKGYTQIEHLPCDMEDGKFARRISSRIENDELVVVIKAATVKTDQEICAGERYAEIRDRQRRASSRMNRTISVRRK